MKNIRLLSILFLCTVVISSCKKKQEDVPELDKLPAATQVGANTAGCLVNGLAFLPKTSLLSSAHPYQCNYQYIKGDYFFTLAINYDSDPNSVYSVVINSDSLAMSTGQTYKFQNLGIPKTISARYYHILGIATDEYFTKPSIVGEISITKLDQNKQIVSGTFFFDAVNKQGGIVHVTDGRFDMLYTQ